MYFEGRPKDARADLYDRLDEYNNLKDLIVQRTPLILVRGLRRTGKTSLIRTCLNEEKELYVWVDLRALASKNKIRKAEVLTLFENSINNLIKAAGGIAKQFLDAAGRISGVTVMGNGISFHDKPGLETATLFGIFEELDSWIGKNLYFHDYVVLVIDEAQYFNYESDFDMARLLASIYENCKNILVVLSGSEIGLFEKFVNGVEKSDTLSGSALSGFSKGTVTLSRLTTSQSEDYLRKGFEQLNPDFQS